MEELKPCPFCGETYEHKANCYLVMLTKMIEDDWRELPIYSNEEMDAAWNTRAERTTHNNGMCECCGYPLYSDYDNYCAKCGAKVVE